MIYHTKHFIIVLVLEKPRFNRNLFNIGIIIIYNNKCDIKKNNIN